MMTCKHGVTLMELIIVIIIIGAAIALGLPNYITSTEQAKASNAQHNLLAIYSAQQNYNNNNGGNSNFCLASCGSLAQINTNLSLQIQDDGTYTYACAGTTCTATRSSGSPTLTLSLVAPVQINNSSANANQECPIGTTQNVATSNPKCV